MFYIKNSKLRENVLVLLLSKFSLLNMKFYTTILFPTQKMFALFSYLFEK